MAFDEGPPRTSRSLRPSRHSRPGRLRIDHDHPCAGIGLAAALDLSSNLGYPQPFSLRTGVGAGNPGHCLAEPDDEGVSRAQ